jgi:hypothetical protein
VAQVRVLREGAVCELGQVPEHLIARSEAPDVLANGLDLPGDVETQARMPRPAHPDAHTCEERSAVQIVEVALIQGRRADADKHFAFLDDRLLDVAKRQDIG